MKKIAIALGVLVLVLVAAAVLALRNLNTYLAENREWIEGQVQTALGRPVTFGELGASLGWGVSARVSELAIADDPAYASEPFLRAGDARVRVKLLPLLSGRVEVGRVVITEPEIRVIQTARGMNIDSLGAAGDAAPPSDAAGADDAGDTSTAAVAVALVRIDEGRLLYRDTRIDPVSEIEVGGLDVDFRSDGDLENFRGRLEVAAPTLRLRSGEEEDAQWEPLRVEADLEREGDVLHIRDASLRAADLRLDLDAVARGLSGEPSLEATFSSPGGAVSGVPFEGLDGALRYEGARASFESLVLRVFGGQIDATGVYNMRNPERPSFRFDTQVEGLRVERAVASQSEAAAQLFSGEVKTALRLAGVGSAWEAIRPSLRGEGQFELLDGVLREVNLAESALGGLADVPGLQDLLGGGLRDKYPALFGAEETRFERAHAQLEIGAGLVLIQALELAARDFAIRGAGQIGLDGRVDVPTRLVCSEALGLDLLERQDKLEALRSEAGRLEFPLRVRGTLPTLRPEPDIAAVAAAVGRRRVGDLLGRALGGRDSGSDGESPEAGEGSDSKELLKKGLDSLFGR